MSTSRRVLQVSMVEEAQAVKQKHLEEAHEETEITVMTLHQPPCDVSCG